MRESRFRLGEAVLLSLSTAVLIFALFRVNIERPSVVRDWDALDSALLGEVARGFELATVDGDTVELPRNQRATLVITHRTTCVFCERSLAAWRDMASRACALDIVIVSAEPLSVVDDYWRDLRMSGCAHMFVGSAIDAATFAHDYQVEGSPRHYLLDSAHTLQSVWYGALEGRLATRRFVRRALMVTDGP